jgi:hypothetical protein
MAGPPSRNSLPSVPGEPRVRRLGVGSSGSGDRPLRAQMVVALACVTMLIAVPLYLWRKPSNRGASAAASASGSGSAGSLATPAAPRAAPAPPVVTARIKLGAVQKVRCGSTAGASPNEGTLCDSLGGLEEALKKAILESESCAPKGVGSINFVLTVDFPKKKTHVYPGASGEWRGKQARRATNCVGNALKAPDLGALPHQYRFYALAVLANYGVAPTGGLAPGSAPPAASAGPALPTFE